MESVILPYLLMSTVTCSPGCIPCNRHAEGFKIYFFPKKFEVLRQPVTKSDTKIKACQLSNMADTHI